MARDNGGSAGLPPHLDPRRGADTPRPPRSARRRKSNKIVNAVRGLAALLSLVLLVGAGMTSNLYARLSSQAGTGQSVDDIDGNDSGDGIDGEDMNILIVGNDSRIGYTDPALQNELGATGADPSRNTDTIMLIHVPADGSQASIVSFPRDSYVDIPGYQSGKINSAYSNGYALGAEGGTEQQKQDAGQKTLIQTVSALSGVKIDHYVEVTLLGFYKLTNALGGIEVNLCKPAQDPDYTGIDLPAGKQTLGGKDALRFVRQRHNLPNGDLDRIKRQQYFIGAVIRKVLNQDLLDLLNYGQLTKLIDSLADTITYDQNLSPFELAEQMRNIAGGNVKFYTVPIADAGAKIDGQDVIQLAPEDQLKAFFKTLNDPPAATKPSTSAAPTVAPGEVTVDVYNASGVAGLGTETANKLSDLGFVQGLVESAEVVAETTISYGPDSLAKAKTLAAKVPGAVLEEDPALAGKVQLTIGSTFAGLAGSAESSQPAATTSKAPDQTAAGDGCVN